MNFSDLGLSPEVLRAVEEAGYSQPTPIQERAIPIVLQGRDVMGCAQTGTGKTASFALPILDILSTGRARARMPRALILEPTRELAAQVAESFAEYGKYSKFETALLIGGTSMDDQNRQLEAAPDIIIATPGRLLDHAERGQVMLRGVKILVIDETDRMLDMGFIPDVQRIVKLLPPLRQTLFFSATLSPEIRALGAEFVHNPKEITVAPPSSTATSVRQAVVLVEQEMKREALRRLISSEKIEQCIIFLNRKRDVDILLKSMKKHGFSAAGIHGDLAQSVRTETLEKFKAGQIAFLIASDVAARGLDVESLPWVINFDVPINAEDYVHRIGRTARAGRSGTAFTLATPDDARFLAQIHQLIGQEIPSITIEGIETPQPLSEDEARARRGRGGRGRGGERGGRRGAAGGSSTGGAGRSGRERGGRSGAPARPSEAPAPQHAAPESAPAAAVATVPAPVVHPNPPPQQVQPQQQPQGRGRDGHGRGRDRDRGREGHGRQERQPERQQPRPAPQARPDPSAPDSVRAAAVMGGHVPAFLLRGPKR